MEIIEIIKKLNIENAKFDETNKKHK